MEDSLEGVVAASTRLSCVDGEAGRLTLADRGERLMGFGHRVYRVLGWSAHCLELLRNGRLIRPQSTYIGP